MNNNFNIVEQLAEQHKKSLYITQEVERLLARENCTQNEIEQIIENLTYEYIKNF